MKNNDIELKDIEGVNKDFLPVMYYKWKFRKNEVEMENENEAKAKSNTHNTRSYYLLRSYKQHC